jgi:hypothetical protein
MQLHVFYLPELARFVETVVNVFFRSVPTVFTTVMMATEMPAAMRPYSIAVAPDSSQEFLNDLQLALGLDPHTLSYSGFPLHLIAVNLSDNFGRAGKRRKCNLA